MNQALGFVRGPRHLRYQLQLAGPEGAGAEGTQ
jgi:hypothetical protein